jgi:hypothetical protein
MVLPNGFSATISKSSAAGLFHLTETRLLHSTKHSMC